MVERLGITIEIRFAADVAGQQEHVELRFHQSLAEVAPLLVVAEPQMDVGRPSCTHRNHLLARD